MNGIPEPTAAAPSHEYESSDISLEVIKVEGKGRNDVHYLLVDVRRSKHQGDAGGIRTFYDASLTIKVHYIFGSRLDLIGEHVSTMGASITGHDKRVKLTNGSVMIHIEGLRGLHIGTYLFYKVVDWAKNNAPGYRIIPISLSNVDAGPKNKDRRNAFYENFGLKFEYIAANGIEKASGRSLETLTTDDLIAYQNWPNIKCEPLHHGLERLARKFDRMRTSLSNAHQGLRYQQRSQRRKESKLDMLTRRINWAMYLVIAFLAFHVGKAIG